MAHDILEFPKDDLLRILPLAFEEDVANGDITSAATISEGQQSEAVIVAKEPGTVAGLPAVAIIFDYRNYPLEFSAQLSDGEEASAGTRLGVIRANTRHLLECERIMLNFLQRMCGVATRTHQFIQALERSNIALLDTRKTIPAFRSLDKYAVRTGGGVNHRRGLFDRVLIKDNHIRAAGSVRAALDAVFHKLGKEYPVEAEIQTEDQLPTLVGSRVDWILLDNMSREEMTRCARFARENLPGVKIEASGNMSLERVRELADLDIDGISVGELTHSAPALDLSLKFL